MGGLKEILELSIGRWLERMSHVWLKNELEVGGKGEYGEEE